MKGGGQQTVGYLTNLIKHEMTNNKVSTKPLQRGLRPVAFSTAINNLSR